MIARLHIPLLLLLCTFGAVQAQPAAASPPPSRPDDSLVLADIRALTSSEMAGRGYLRDGHVNAAVYIVKEWARLGFDTLAIGYAQPFPLRVNLFPVEPALAVDGTGLFPGLDFIPDAGCGTGLGRDAGILNVGSGLVAQPIGADAYAGRSVRGMIVVMDENVPDSVNAALKQAGADPRSAGLPARIRTAADRGAACVVVLVDRLVMDVSDTSYGIPVFEARRTAWHADARSASFSARDSVGDVIAANVMAMQRGTVHPDSLIILCAHYDHLGALGNDLYFPGANDNASGVAMMLSIARYLKEHPLRYSVLYVAFSGEEAGLVGSRYFAGNPPVDLSRVRFLLNMDMTASGADGITAVGGVEFVPEFAMLAHVADSLGVHDVRRRENAPNSDHYPLVRAGVRGFYVYPFTGLQPYHHINDRPATLEWNVFNRLRSIFIGFLTRL
ncbi:MAG TPA: M28 family peptidase [Candidatus Kapabacteria bacterium]|nr:M28 family peptidase [Candidatus Kapabacteria bacterium]